MAWVTDRVVKLGGISDQIKGFAPQQVVFAVLSSRKANASVLYVTIPKHLCDQLARRYRDGREPAHFPQAHVRCGRVTGEGEITLLKEI